MVLSDESVNRYGYRVLSKGIRLEAFLKNPVMLWNHLRNDGWNWTEAPKPIGHWEDVEVDGEDRLVGTPVFDCESEDSVEVARKYKAGTVSACSIGFIPVKFLDDEKDLLPGQKGMTVTEAELLEVSIVDIPANSNAVKLFDKGNRMMRLCYAGALADEHIILNKDSNSKSMKLKKTFSSILAFFGIPVEKAEETEITEQQLSRLNGELARLQAANEGLVNALSILKASKDGEIKELKAQVDSLKKKPAENTASLTDPADSHEDVSSPMDKFNLYVKEHPEDLAGQLRLAKECGIIKDQD